jgi:hypothetical protein
MPQLHSLTWRFFCSCIVLVAASGYILLGALRIASTENQAPVADATADDVAVASADAKDDSGSDGDDSSDDASHIGDDRVESAVVTGPQGGAGVAAAATSLQQRSLQNDRTQSLFLRSTHIAFSSHSAAETLRLLAQRKAAAAVNQPK